jgi:hypothetical protein
MQELAAGGELILSSDSILHNVRFLGCKHYLRRRIDNRAALRVRRMVSATASA